MNLLEADTGGNIVTVARPACSQLFLVYAGAAGQMEGMNEMTFLMQSGLMQRNVVMIRDPKTVIDPINGIQPNYFENGVSDDLPDMDAVIDWHRAYIDSLSHVTEVYAFGNSFGGWSAMFFGYMLAVKKVFALAPAGPWGRDLLLDLMKEPNGVTEYDIWYSRDHAEDRAFAERFEGYPATRLIARDEHGHRMLRGLLSSGELQQAILPDYRAVA